MGPINVANEPVISGKTATDLIRPILVGDEGQILQSAYFESVVIEAPGVSDEYDTWEGTITTGTTDTALAFTNIGTAGYQLMVTCDGPGNITFKLNGTGEPETTVKMGETFATDMMKFASLHISNSSGSNADYRIRAEGN